MDRLETKQLISRTYLALLEKLPEDSITVKRLIQECGFSRQTFYYHFQDILDVAQYSLRSFFHEISRDCSSQNDLRMAIHLFLEIVEKHRQIVKHLDDSSQSKFFRDCMVQGLIETIETVMEDQQLMEPSLCQDDRNFFFTFFAYGVYGSCLERIRKNKPLGVDSLTEKLYRLLQGEMSIQERT